MIPPAVVLAVVSATTGIAWLIARISTRLRHRRLRRAADASGFALLPPPDGLARLVHPHLPHPGAAHVTVLDVLRRADWCVFRCDYTLGSIYRRRNLTRFVRARLTPTGLEDVTVLEPAHGGQADLMSVNTPVQSAS